MRVGARECACGWECVCLWVCGPAWVQGMDCCAPVLGIDRVCLCLNVAWVYSLSPGVRVSDPEVSDGASVPAPGPFRWCFNLDIGDTEGNVTVLLGAVDPAGNAGPLVEQWCAPKRRS